MAPSLFLLFFLSVAVEASEVMSVKSGDDVILTCRADGDSIRAVEWTRTDLNSTYVLLNRDGHFDTTNQHPSFKGRVQLKDSELKDGDVSLILKNVNKNDRGTYECGVATDSSGLDMKTIRSIRLEVTDSDLISVKPGDDVILPCRADGGSIRVVEWTRTDLKSEYVLLNRDGHFDITNQHPSFKDRVQLVESHLKKGDVSVILKNVTMNDTGTYECRVQRGGSGRRKRAIIDSDPIRRIRLVLTDSEEISVKSGEDVTLSCRADGGSITDVEWTRTDPSPAQDILRYRDGPSVSQHFLGRVQLADSELKDGNVSFILKKVDKNDRGTYECRVHQEGSRRRKRAIIGPEPIRRIRLEVTDSGGEHKHFGWIAAVVVVVVVVGVLVARRSRRRS